MSRLAATYLASLESYLVDPGEDTLHAAYELGRETVIEERSLLDLSLAHHDAVIAMLGPPVAAIDSVRIVRAAGEFFLECISAFEMVQRGFHETRDAARLERRHAEMLRQLSGFLSDSSLALEAPDALAEMRHLVAEQAREFVGVECCVVTTGTQAQRRKRSASHVAEALGWRVFARWVDLSRVDEAVWSAGGAVRVSAEDVARLLRTSSADPVPAVDVREWLGAPLTALNGRQLGAIHLVNKMDGEFTTLDEAIALNLAQMSAAAVERAQLYSDAI